MDETKTTAPEGTEITAPADPAPAPEHVPEPVQDCAESAHPADGPVGAPGEEKPVEAPETKPAPEEADPRLIDAELRAAAALAGVPAGKLPYICRMADRAKLTGDLTKAAAAEVAAILQAVPEMARQPVTGSLGDHVRVVDNRSANERALEEALRYMK